MSVISPSRIKILYTFIFRSAESEVSENHEQISDLTMQNQALTAHKRKLEQEADNLKQDTDDMRGKTNSLNFIKINKYKIL